MRRNPRKSNPFVLYICENQIHSETHFGYVMQSSHYKSVSYARLIDVSLRGVMKKYTSNIKLNIQYS